MRRTFRRILVGSLLAPVVGCGAPAPLPAVVAPPTQAVQAQALFPKGVNRLVSDLMVKYDHNKNGVIELERPTGGSLWRRIGNILFWRDERVRSVTNTYHHGEELTLTTRVYTSFPLFFAADGDRDKRVTYEELRSFIAQQYDVNQNGELDARGIRFWRDKNELERFTSDFGERLMTYRDVDIARPSAPSAPPPQPAPEPPAQP